MRSLFYLIRLFVSLVVFNNEWICLYLVDKVFGSWLHLRRFWDFIMCFHFNV